MYLKTLFLIFCSGIGFHSTVNGQVSREAAKHYNEAVLSIKQKDVRAAITSYGKAISVEPNYLKAYYNRGKSYLRLKEYQKAIKDFRKVTSLDLDYAMAYYYLGYSHLQSKEYPAAISSYNRALSKDLSLTDTYKNRGIAYMKEGKYKNAISDFSEAYKHKPEDLSVIYNRAICYAKLEAHQRSIDDYQLLVNEAYKPNITAKELGKSLVKKENYSHALKAFNVAAEYSDKEEFEVFYLKGYCQLKLENIDKAHEAFKKAAQRKNDHIPTLKNLAFTSFKLKDYQTASTSYGQLISATPDDPTLHLNRGLSLMQLELYDDAINDFNVVIEHNPEMATAFYNRATAAIALKNNSMACEDMRQAARLGYQDAFNHIASTCGDN